MNRRVVAGAAAALLVLVAALAVPPDVAFARLAWLAADPVRLVAALLVLAAVRPFLAWPTTLLAVLAGYGFGLAGAPLALALITLTSVPTYLLARRGRTDLSAAATSSRLAAGAVRAVDAGERAVAVAGDTRAVAASRLVPAPSDVVSVGAGLAGVPL